MRRQGKKVRIGFNKVVTEEEEWVWLSKREEKWFRK
jgi:hypothetical protein